jgi:hypothetical protein
MHDEMLRRKRVLVQCGFRKRQAFGRHPGRNRV